MIAGLLRVAVLRWRSRQLALTLSCPSSNHVCSILFAAVSHTYLRPTVGFLNQSSVAACSSQNWSGSLIERSYIFLYCSALMWARLITSGLGGNVRVSCISELVETVLVGFVMVGFFLV